MIHYGKVIAAVDSVDVTNYCADVVLITLVADKHANEVTCSIEVREEHRARP